MTLDTTGSTPATPLVIAHAGASAVRTPNTIEAFLEARRLGSDMVELDVRLTADGAVVVHHDAEVPGVGLIYQSPVSALPEWVPLLEAAMVACEGMDVNVEIKANPQEVDAGTAPALAAAVAALVDEGGYLDRVIVSSFAMTTIDAVRLAQPNLPTAWLIGQGWDAMRACEQAAARGHVALHPWHLLVSAELIDRAHELGLAVNTWTCDEADHMAQMADWGIDGICTNVPDVAVATLRSRP